MYAIDREFAKDVIWNGLGKVGDRPVRRRPSSSTPTTCRNTRYDPAKAKALLKEAGYKGEKVRLLPLPYGETWQRWGEAVKQNLAGRRHEYRDHRHRRRRLATRRSATGTTTSPSPISISTAIPRSAWAATTSPATSPRASPSTTSRATPIRRSTSCSPTARSPRRIRSARKSTRRSQKILRRGRAGGLACSNCSSRPSPHCKIKNLITTGIGVNDGFRDAWIDK